MARFGVSELYQNNGFPDDPFVLSVSMFYTDIFTQSYQIRVHDKTQHFHFDKDLYSSTLFLVAVRNFR